MQFFWTEDGISFALMTLDTGIQIVNFLSFWYMSGGGGEIMNNPSSPRDIWKDFPKEVSQERSLKGRIQVHLRAVSRKHKTMAKSFPGMGATGCPCRVGDWKRGAWLATGRRGISSEKLSEWGVGIHPVAWELEETIKRWSRVWHNPICN